MKKAMKKAMVIGCPGCGKSTFSRALHEAVGLPLYHLDMMYWNADRSKVPKSVFMKRLSDVMEKEAWIIDGNFASTIELRLQACDTVFFLDYPLSVCLEGLQMRKGKERPDIPWVETDDTEDPEFAEFVRNYNAVSRPAVMALLEQYSFKNVYIFKSRDEAGEYLAQLRCKKER